MTVTLATGWLNVREESRAQTHIHLEIIAF